MVNYSAKYTDLKELSRRLAVAFTGVIALCAISCHSTKQMELKERTLRTERIGQEVILLPESEQLIVDLSTLENLAPASALTQPVQADRGGLTVKKRKDGLIEIESRRDTVRIRSDAICNHSIEDTKVIQKSESGNKLMGWLALLFLVVALIALKQ